MKTDDLKYDSKLAYGNVVFEMVKDKRQTSRTILNAENWSYYLCSYRVDARIVTKERGNPQWKWLHPSDWNGGRLSYLSDTKGLKINNDLLKLDRVQSLSKVPVKQKKLKRSSKPKGFQCYNCKKIFEAEFMLIVHMKECIAKK